MNPLTAATTSTVTPFVEATAGRRHAARAARWACISVIALLAPLAILAWSDSLLAISTNWRWVALVITLAALIDAAISFTRA